MVNLIQKVLLMILCTIFLAISVFGATVNVSTNVEYLPPDKYSCFINKTDTLPCDYGLTDITSSECKQDYQSNQCELRIGTIFLVPEGSGLNNAFGNRNNTASELFYLPDDLINFTYHYSGFGYVGGGCTMPNQDCRAEFWYRNQSSGNWVLIDKIVGWHTPTAYSSEIPLSDLIVSGNGSIFETYMRLLAGYPEFSGSKVNYTYISGTCTNNWTCSESYCHPSLKVTVCTGVTDLNSCGNEFDEDYTQFSEPCETLFVGEDLHKIGFDVIGEAGYQLKVNIPLVILSLVSMIAIGIYVTIKIKIK